MNENLVLSVHLTLVTPLVSSRDDDVDSACNEGVAKSPKLSTEILGPEPAERVVALVTLVSHSQPLWWGVTRGGVAPVFPFGASP